MAVADKTSSKTTMGHSMSMNQKTMTSSTEAPKEESDDDGFYTTTPLNTSRKSSVMGYNSAVANSQPRSASTVRNTEKINAKPEKKIKKKETAQLERWAYETQDDNLTFIEHLEKAAWEGRCEKA